MEFVADATQRELAKISLGLSASGSLSGSTFEGPAISILQLDWGWSALP